MIRAANRSEGGALETKQMTLATAGFAIKTKTTRRAQFLAELDNVVPWRRLLAVIEPHYPVAEQGRPRPPVERMLRIYFMQQWRLGQVRTTAIGGAVVAQRPFSAGLR